MTNFTIEQQTILSLLRRALWQEDVVLPAEPDWAVVDQIAREQAVLPLVYAGAVRCKEEVPADILGQWKAITFSSVLKNERLMQAQDELFAALQEAAIPAVLLKGCSVARYYPQPDLRRLGDIDVLVRPQDTEVTLKVMDTLGYTLKEKEHDFHYGYSRVDAYVEVHYQASNFSDSAGGKRAKALANSFFDEMEHGEIGRHEFPVLSPENQGLSLILHMVRHMFNDGIGLRQLVDWMMYVYSLGKGVFATRVAPRLASCGLLRFASVAMKTCVCYLGLPERYVEWCENVVERSALAFIMDLFRGGNMGNADENNMGSLFTDDASMGRRQSPLQALIAGLNRHAYHDYPITQKVKILLPFFWVAVVICYAKDRTKKADGRKSFIKAFTSATTRRQLFDELHLFEMD